MIIYEAPAQTFDTTLLLSSLW